MSLFDQEEPIISVDENKDYLAELVGEGKKFKDVSELAKGKALADAFVETLKQEQAELRKDYLALRKEYEARPALEELVAQLTAAQQTSNELPPVNDVETPATIKPEDIENLVAKKLQEAQKTQQQERNYQEVQAKLQERFGPNYPTILSQQISNLGLTKEFAEDLAKNHPAVFYKTFGVEAQTPVDTFQSPPRSSVRTFAPSIQKRDWEYYEKLRKDPKSNYWDPKTQLQMMRDKAELGDAFGNPQD